MSHMIELKKVSKFYTNKDTVSTGFARVDLTLDKGEFVAITGESGSGKSTLINVLSGLDTYEEGTMLVGGEDTSGYVTKDYEEYRKKYIGNIFQDFNLIASYTVYQNIELAMLLAGKKASECKTRIKELIELVGLTKYTRTKVSKLSGGQKQRVAIARVLSKDAPIIIADEPTGNLDSVSAAKVMETLGRISKDKLVVVVTHNYEQVEPYVTRKVTMHDGRIIEDKKFERTATEAELRDGAYAALNTLAYNYPESYAGAEVQVQETGSFDRADVKQKKTKKERKTRTNITAGSQLRLGIRNTFNLPAKFLLLLMVYTFVAAAILGQYGSTKATMHETAGLGYNWYFVDMNPDRLIVTKEDSEAFTDEEFEAISNTTNVESIIRDDILVDSTARLRTDKLELVGQTIPVSNFDESKLTAGRMPEKDFEIVLSCDPNAYDYESIKNGAEGMLGKEYWLDSEESPSVEWGQKLVRKKVKIVGIAVIDETDELNISGQIKMYVSDYINNVILTRTYAALSDTTFSCNGKSTTQYNRQSVRPSNHVSKGEAYVFEDAAYTFHDEGKVQGKDIKVSVSNTVFKDDLKLTVGAVVKEDNINALLGIKKDEYYDVCDNVYVNPSDYRKLFNKGSYQCCVYVKDSLRLESTVNALKDQGYKVFVMKDSLSTYGDAFLKVISWTTLIFQFVLLFFIAYAVIRLIMRSRNTYYSTLRILGANKRHTDNILKIELVSMMVIAYGLVMSLVVLVRKNIITLADVAGRVEFLKDTDYIILFAALLAMSFLIANRYSRKLFGKSAMNVYREEA